jgi:hypothetical protein
MNYSLRYNNYKIRTFVAKSNSDSSYSIKVEVLGVDDSDNIEIFWERATVVWESYTVETNVKILVEEAKKIIDDFNKVKEELDLYFNKENSIGSL